MAEQEELQLRVSLDDQASAQLAALRGQLDQMRGTGGAAAQIQQASPQIVAAIGQVVQSLTAMAEQIAQLPTQITAAMSGAVQGLQQVQTQLTQVSTNVQQTAQAVAGMPAHVAQGTQALGTAIRQAGFFGGIAAGVTAEFIGQLSQLGNNLLQRSTDFHGLADSMKDVETRSKGVGMSMTEYIGEQRALQIGGMTPEQAKAEISRRADLSAELKQYGAENAPTTLRLIQDTDLETTNNIIKTMKAMEGADPATQTKLWKQLHDQIQQTMTLEDIKQGREHPGEGFEGAWKQLSERAGMDPAAYANFDVSRYEEYQRFEEKLNTPEREAMLKRRTEETKRFTEQSLIASFLWEDIGKSIASSLLQTTGLSGAMSQMNEFLVEVLKSAEKFDTVFRETGSFEKALGALAPAWAPFGKAIDDTYVELKLVEGVLNQANTIAQNLGKTTHDWVVELRNALGLEPDKPKLPEIKGGGKPIMFWSPKDFSDWHSGKGWPQWTDEEKAKAGEKAKAAGQEPQQQPQPQGAQPQPPTQPPPPPPPEQPPQTEFDKRFGAWPPDGGKPIIVPPESTELTPEQQERYRRRFGRGQRQSYEEGVGQPSIVPASYEEGTGKPIIVPASMVQAQPQGGGQQVSPDVMQALIKSAQPEVDGQPNGLHEGVQLAGYKSRVASEIAEQFTTPKGLVRSGADLAEMAKSGLAPEAPTMMDALLSALPLGLGEIPKFLKGHQEAGDPLLGKLRFMLGIPDANVPTPAPWAKGGAWHKGQDEGADQAEGFDNRFGVWPGMGADKLDQTSAKLDQAANTNVNISGAGKIQVDVRAPPGTSVDASGEGFFKSTEITRLTQMLPADMGPLPMTGVGAGQGVAGNGTVA